MKAIVGAFLMMLFMGAAWAKGPCKTLTVTGNAEYPPLTWQCRKNPGRIDGCAIELLELALKDLGIQVVGKYAGPWARAQVNVQSGQVDMLAGAYLTEARRAHMDYIFPPFITDPTVVFIRKGDSFKFDTWDDLVGLRGGAPLGNSFGETFDRFEQTRLTIERVPRIDQAFDKLLAGRSRYVVYGLYPGLAHAEQSGRREQLSYLPTSIISEGAYFAISKKSPCNTPQFREYLARKVQELVNRRLPEQLMEKHLALWRDETAQ